MKWVQRINSLKEKTKRCLLVILVSTSWDLQSKEAMDMYMYAWVPLLSTWNYNNIVNWLYINIK